ASVFSFVWAPPEQPSNTAQKTAATIHRIMAAFYTNEIWIRRAWDRPSGGLPDFDPGRNEEGPGRQGNLGVDAEFERVQVVFDHRL
ncbi:hypothetical protein ABTN11_20605, partial [Acinetobacter baumannii]